MRNRLNLLQLLILTIVIVCGFGIFLYGKIEMKDGAMHASNLAIILLTVAISGLLFLLWIFTQKEGGSAPSVDPIYVPSDKANVVGLYKEPYYVKLSRQQMIDLSLEPGSIVCLRFGDKIQKALVAKEGSLHPSAHPIWIHPNDAKELGCSVGDQVLIQKV